jgi:hypothetical protein
MEERWQQDSGDRHEQVVVTEQAGFEQRREVVKDYAAERYEILRKVSQLIWLLFGVLEGLIGLRVVLKLIAANPANPFASLVYALTDLFLWPFFGLTANPAFNDIVLEITSLIAMIVYALVGWLTVRLLWLLFYHTPTRSVRYYERDRLG